MKKQLQVVLAGVIVVVPLGLTAYVVWWCGAKLEWLGRQLWPGAEGFPGLGAVIVIAAMYLVGLLTRLWVFRGLVGRLDGVLTRLPGIKTVYESVRDLMRLFGGESGRMGRVVQYRPPGTDLAVLGILTNDSPEGAPPGAEGRKVAVYLPYSYMFGGPTVFVSPEHVRDVDMPVEQALKLCATAHVGAAPEAAPRGDPAREK